ncbi:MAG: hypothetical protein HY053_00740 [Proteobacteria bacterium]|nr:hypothetical protein [Pseudomonadota bacterium]
MSFTPFNPFQPPPPQRPNFIQQPQPPLVDKKGRPIDPRTQKRREIMRFLLNPELGSGLEGLHETHGMFLRLICNIFLQTGVIDAAYPGIADPKQLTLLSLLHYAASHLEFTQEGMPRVLMFGAFVASLLAMVLTVIFFIVHVLSVTKI